jgi:trans-2-enoyl-CoA reductase
MAGSHCLRLRPLASGLARPSAKLNAQHMTRLPMTAARYKSGPYGYTQAKALVFSKPGEPSDVLRRVTHSP